MLNKIIILIFLLSIFFNFPAFADRPKGQDGSIVELTKRTNSLDKKVVNLEQNAAQIKLEAAASKKLLDISEANLNIPKTISAFVAGFVFLLGLFGSIALFIMRNSLIERIQNLMKDVVDSKESLKLSLDNLSKEQEDRFNLLRIRLEQNERDHCELLAQGYDLSGVDAFTRGKLNTAIAYGEKSVSYAEKVLNIADEAKKNSLYKYKGNLAYYYAEHGRVEKTGIAIKYAKEGLTAGVNTYNLDHIDNYLYVIMKMSHNPDDLKEWIRIFKNYKDAIFKANIRNAEEQKEYLSFYEKTKETL